MNFSLLFPFLLLPFRCGRQIENYDYFNDLMRHKTRNEKTMRQNQKTTVDSNKQQTHSFSFACKFKSHFKFIMRFGRFTFIAFIFVWSTHRVADSRQPTQSNGHNRTIICPTKLVCFVDDATQKQEKCCDGKCHSRQSSANGSRIFFHFHSISFFMRWILCQTKSLLILFLDFFFAVFCSTDHSSYASSQRLDPHKHLCSSWVYSTCDKKKDLKHEISNENPLIRSVSFSWLFSSQRFDGEKIAFKWEDGHRQWRKRIHKISTVVSADIATHYDGRSVTTATAFHTLFRFLSLSSLNLNRYCDGMFSTPCTSA